MLWLHAEPLIRRSAGGLGRRDYASLPRRFQPRSSLLQQEHDAGASRRTHLQTPRESGRIPTRNLPAMRSGRPWERENVDVAALERTGHGTESRAPANADATARNPRFEHNQKQKADHPHQSIAGQRRWRAERDPQAILRLIVADEGTHQVDSRAREQVEAVEKLDGQDVAWLVAPSESRSVEILLESVLGRCETRCERSESRCRPHAPGPPTG